MTSVLLPSGRIRSFHLKPFPEAPINESALGTNSQRFVRAAQRWIATVQLSNLTPAQARLWSDLVRTDVTHRLAVVQTGLDTGAPGSPLVAGAGQAGSILNIDGVAEGYTVRKGQFVSIVTNALRYLYQVTADVTADESGAVALPVFPLLRVTPNDNDVVEIAQPYIEGLVQFEGFRDGLDYVEGPAFTLQEQV